MKKVLKIFIVILVILVVAIVARKIYYNVVEIEPNDLYLTKENTEESFIATKGSYSWNDKGVSVIGDSISPLEMDYSKIINVRANDKIYFSDDNWTSVGASVILAQGRKEIAKVTIESNLEGKYIVVPEIEPGEYVVQINLESDKGDVWYATKISISE